MRNNQPITGRQRHFSADQKLISSTDLRGIIQHCNDAFVEVSGFSREELIGQPHNLVRHPDMPPAVFGVMWQYLRAGKPWMGVVKNRCNNGDHYWVNAYVTPVLSEGKVVGYESVRVKPSEEDVRRAERAYKAIADKRANTHALVTTLQPHLETAAVLALSLGLGWWLAGLLPEDMRMAAALVPTLSMFGLEHIRRRRDLNAISSHMPHAFRDPVAVMTYTDHDNTLGSIETGIISDSAHLNTVITRLNDAASIVASQAIEANALNAQATQAVREQQRETEMVATAMNEMSATIHEVSANVQQTADQAAEAERYASDSRNAAQETRAAIINLRDTVDTICQAVSELATQTEQIASVSEMIEQIAEQTNLLALNAAIEAARAGEAGRGFAVVADEVRQLARRTRDSTKQIQSTVTSLRDRASSAVIAAESGQRAAVEGVDKVENTHAMLDGITGSVNRIAQMAAQMATAVEEQAHVSEDINRQVARISELAHTSLLKGTASMEKSQSMEQTAENLHELVERFKRD